MNRRSFLSNLLAGACLGLAGACLGLARSLPMPSAPSHTYRVRTALPAVTWRPMHAGVMPLTVGSYIQVDGERYEITGVERPLEFGCQ